MNTNLIKTIVIQAFAVIACLGQLIPVKDTLIIVAGLEVVSYVLETYKISLTKTATPLK